MKAKLIFQKESKVIKNGVNPWILSYDLGNYYNSDEVDQFLLKKIPKIPNHDKILIGLNVRYKNLGNKWLWNDYTIPSKVKCLGTYLEDSKVAIEDTQIRYIQIYTVKKPTEKKEVRMVGEDDENNDCFALTVFKCLQFNKSLLPKSLNREWKWKKFFGLYRDDKIPLTNKNLKQLEQELKCSFIISGDVDYTSDIIQKQNFVLHVKNGHIDVKCNEGRKNKLIPKKKENIFSLKFIDDKIIICDGESEKEISDEKYKELTHVKYMLLKCNEKDDMFKIRSNYIKKANKLYDASNGLINYYKSQYPSALGYDIWRQLTKYLSEPEELDEFEEQILKLYGGIHFYKKGRYENTYDYDVNSMYMYYMSSKSFIFPVVKPTYKVFSEKEFNELKFFPFGYYLVEFDGEHPYFKIYNGWVTHTDLKCAQLLNIKINIVCNKTNALLYDSKNCVRGNVAFENYCKYLFDMKQKFYEAKDLTVKTWGFFYEKIYKRLRVKNNETYELGTEQIEEINETENLCILKTSSGKGHKRFKRSMARMAPFLTAYCRFNIIKIMMQDPDHLKNIVHINTDGFISLKERKDLQISDDMGDFKIKHKGNCEVFNSMRVIYN